MGGIDISNLFFGNGSKLIECVNTGLVEFCINYKTENVKKFVIIMIEYIYLMGIKDNAYRFEREIKFYHRFYNYMEYSKYIIDNLKNHKLIDSEILVKYYLDKFEKCYNYLLNY